MTLEQLKQYLLYDASTGMFIWIKRPSPTVAAWTLAGTVTTNGYLHISFKGKLYLAQRLAVFYMTGKWPSNYMDHKDRNKLNNAWYNLREVTNQENQEHSIKPLTSNKSGYRGVHKFRNGWAATMRVDGKKKWLGQYPTPEEAHQVYMQAKEQHHKGYLKCILTI